ncbi:MAG: CsgG/HfaB family protein [candidate division KSB1 bacterium]
MFAVMLLLNACSASRPLQEAASSQDELTRELARLRAVLKANPNAHEAVRDLGIVLYEMKEHKNAALVLEKALLDLPNDGLTRLALGMAYEQLRRWNDAIKLYRDDANVAEGEYRRQLRGRLELAIQAKLRAEARQALADEQTLAPSRVPANSIAVMKFQNLGSAPELAPMATGLADMVITDLSQVHSLTVIERSRIHALLEEMGLGQSGLVEENSAPRVGNLLGARKIVQGSFLEVKEKELRLDANLADAAVRTSKSAGKVSGALARFFRLEKDLVFKVIRALGIQPTEAEEQAILIIPTENLLAFLAYARGLEARDRGEYEIAEQEFQNAVKADVKFSRARAQLERTRSMRQTLATKNLPIRMSSFRPRLALQQRRMRLAQATMRANPGFSFVNQGRVSLLAPRLNNLPGANGNVRQPLLEGRSDFGLPGEIRIGIKLP